MSHQLSNPVFLHSRGRLDCPSVHAPLGALVVLTSPSTFLNIILLKATICSDLLIVQWHWSAALFLSLHVHLNNSSHIWLSDPGSTGVSNTGAELSTGKSRARTRGNLESSMRSSGSSLFGIVSKKEQGYHGKNLWKPKTETLTPARYLVGPYVVSRSGSGGYYL